MKVKYILIKKMLLSVLLGLAAYQLFILSLGILSQPKYFNLTFQPINQAIMQTNAPNISIELTTESSDFEYKVIGYRAGTSRASIIVKRNNQSFVVQQGELLENKYKLVSVDLDSAIFEYMGKKYELKTELTNGKK